MSRAPETLEDGATLFREEEAATVAYVLVSGSVDLTRSGSQGPVLIASLGKGELVGEAALVEGGRHPVTATARGPVTLQALDARELMARIEAEPDLSRKIIARLARRLGALSERVADLATAAHTKAEAGGKRKRRKASKPRSRPASDTPSLPVPATAGGGGDDTGGGLLDRLLDLLRLRRGGSGGSDASGPGGDPVVVALAAFPNDSGDSQRQRIAAAFKDLPGVSLRTLSKAVEVEGEDTPLRALAKAGILARRLLDQEQADILVWGLVDPPAGLVEVRFAGPHSLEDDRPGLPHPVIWLALPVDFGPEWNPLLRGQTLAAIEPRSETQAQAIATLLPQAVEEGRRLGLSPPGSLDAMEQVAILSCYGNAAAALAYHARNAAYGDLAVDAFGAAIGLLPRDADLEWGLLHRAIGGVLFTMAERSDTSDLLAQAVDAYRAALEAIHRAETPREWAGLQNRLGTALYKSCLSEGRLDELKGALQCLQSALQIFTRAEAPAKWAEVMNTLAQVLQVYGDHARSTDILERAANACRQALEVRSFDAAPLAWAAGQNNLGSALFLLAKHSQRRDALEEAADSFRQALGTYRMLGAEHLAGVTEKNLKRVEDLLRKTGGEVRGVVDPEWADRPTTLGGEDTGLGDTLGDEPATASPRGGRAASKRRGSGGRTASPPPTDPAADGETE